MDSNLLSTILSVISIAIGLIIAWYFFRIQQRDELGKIKENTSHLLRRFEKIEKYVVNQHDVLNKTSNGLTALNNKLDMSEALKQNNTIIELKSTLESLNKSIDTSLTRIKESIDENYNKLKLNMKNDLLTSSKQITSDVEKAFKQEIKLFVPSELESNILTGKLLESVVKFYQGINQIQLNNLNTEGNVFVKKIEDKLEKTFEDFQLNITNSSVKIEDTIKLPQSIPHGLPANKDL